MRVSEEKVLLVKDMITNTDETFKAIGQHLNINVGTITRINRGDTYIDIAAEYPLRQTQPIKVHKLERKERIEAIRFDLRFTNTAIKRIAAEYDVHFSTVSRMNNGERNRMDTLDYPLRKK